MARLTLNGMYQYDPTLFEGMILPTGYDTDALFSEIMKRSGQLYPYHQVPSILKADIRLWFSRNYLNFDRIMDALTAEYSPIENYNRVEAWTRTPNLTDKSTLSGKDSTAASGDDVTKHTGTDSTERTYTNFKETVDYKGDDTRETQVSAFDSSSYQPSEKITDSRSSREDEKTTSGSYKDSTTHGHTETFTNGRKDETTYGKVDTVTHTGTEGYRSNIHGNIGVTTSQQMITSELELRKFDIYSDIANRFEREFLVQVY